MVTLLSLSALVAQPAIASDWAPSPDDLAVHKALTARHWDGDCATVEALATEPVQTLQNIVDHASAPPWAPMRAATCLLRGHATEKQAEIERWVTEPELLGLGILTLQQIDDLPEAVALSVAERALASGQTELDAQERLSSAKLDSIRALVTQ